MSSLTFILVALLLCAAVDLAQSNQSVCTNGGVDYWCPTVNKEYNRWGIAFRNHIPYGAVTQSVLFDPSNFSMTATMDTLMVNVSAYLAGANTNKSVIPLLLPHVLMVVARGNVRSLVLRQPLPYGFDPPASTNPSVHFLNHTDDSTVKAVLWWHGKATDESIMSHYAQLVTVMKFHGTTLSPSLWMWASWTGPDSEEYYNEVWGMSGSMPPPPNSEESVPSNSAHLSAE